MDHPHHTDRRITAVRPAIEFMYDLQKMRIAMAARARKEVPSVQLTEDDQEFLKSTSEGLNLLEKQALKYTAKKLKGIPIYDNWLADQKGVGPTMAAVMLSSFDIYKADTPSKFWSYCGLAVDSRTGKAQSRIKGEKAKYDPWLKAKMVKVLADVFIKCNSPWRKFYDDYKFRKVNQLIDTCMLCEGKGRVDSSLLRAVDSQPAGDEERAAIAQSPIPAERAEHPQSPGVLERVDSAEPYAASSQRAADAQPPKKEKRANARTGKLATCPNCKGTGGPAPWGKSDGHRSQAAKRYMIKMFLAAFWNAWRSMEGLPIRPSYAEQYLGRVHHSAP